MHALLIILLGLYLFGVLFFAVMVHHNLGSVSELAGIPNWVQTFGSIIVAVLWPVIILVSVLANRFGKAKS